MNETQILALALGGLFGAALILSELADPDRIIGALRLRDFHAMRTIGMFVVTSMAGVWVLEQAGLANLSIKPAVILPVLLGGGLLGVGFGMTGFCPGTGLACAAAGRGDAWVSVLAMSRPIGEPQLPALMFTIIWAASMPFPSGSTTLPVKTTPGSSLMSRVLVSSLISVAAAKFRSSWRATRY